jgi:hypothetical protein
MTQMTPIKDRSKCAHFLDALLDSGGAVVLSLGDRYACGGGDELYFVPLFEDGKEAMSYANEAWEGARVERISPENFASFFLKMEAEGFLIAFFLKGTRTPLIFDSNTLYELLVNNFRDEI